MKKVLYIFLAVIVLPLALFHPALAQAAGEQEPRFPTSQVLYAPVFDKTFVNSAQILSDESISLTPGTANTYGALWSKPEYQLDLNQDFNATFELNFGNKGNAAGDGMMFVLQDASGFTYYTYGGASLGALGSETHNGPLGIPRSFAVEFDLFYNKGKGDFDYHVNKIYPSGHHVAFLWPGERSTYQDRHALDFFSPPRTVQHYGTTHFDNLSNGQWHLFEINWDANSEVLTYQFNEGHLVPVHGLKEKVGSTTLNWGFTGASAGTYTEQRVVINSFSGLPGLINGSFDQVAINTKTDRETTILYPNDILRFELILDYLNGSMPWRNLILNYTLDNLLYEPGTLHIRYTTGEEESPGDGAFVQNVLTLPLKDLDWEKNSAHISFLVRVPDDISVPSVLRHTAAVDSANDPLPLQVFEQTIAPESSPTLTSDQYPRYSIVDDSETFTLTGTWKDINISWLFIQVSNEQQQIGSELEIFNTNMQNTTGYWEFTGSVNALRYGENLLSIRIENSSGKGQSLDVRVVLRVGGLLAFAEPPGNMEAADPLKLMGQENIYRLEIPDIHIIDTRKPGSTWQLKLNLREEFASGYRGLSSELYYQNEKGQKSVITADEVVIMEHTSVDYEEVELSQKGTAGFYIRISPGAFIGDYKATLNWILE